MILIKKIFVGIAFLLNAIILEGCTISYSDGEGNNGIFHANSDDIFMYGEIFLYVIGAVLLIGAFLYYYFLVYSKKKKDDEKNDEKTMKKNELL